MTREERAKLVCDLLEAIGEEPRKYSGRAMYGAQCVGVVPERARSEADLVINVLEEVLDRADDDVDPAETLRALRRSRSDSMGLGFVVYWPDLPWPEGREEESGEEDEE